MPWVLILDRALTCMWSYSVVSTSLRPWTVTHQAPLSRDAPGKNTGEGCHILLQGIFPTQESNWHLLHCRRTLHHWAIGEARRTPKILLISWLIGTSSAKYLVLVPGSWHKSFEDPWNLWSGKTVILCLMRHQGRTDGGKWANQRLMISSMKPLLWNSRNNSYMMDLISVL